MAIASPSVVTTPQALVGPGLSPLEGARIDVAIDDLLAAYTLTQRFRNASVTDIEAVFTFPIPVNAVFLGLTATLGDRELEGRIIEKQKASREYEVAIAAGDSAVLVERTHDGMLTANVGNLRPGDTISVRLKFAEWLAFNGTDVRFRMPTAIAPRYGAPDMSPRDQPVTDLLAQYQFAAEVRVRGLLAKSQLESPSHLLLISRDEDAVVLTLKSAWMDRDFLLDARFTDVDRCSAIADHDDDGDIVSVAIAADFDDADEHLDVALVVDCSGSMGGMSIALARSALTTIVAGLQQSDRVDLIRFGSRHDAVFGEIRDLTRDTRSLLEQYITATDANLGGTETIPALEAAATSLERSGRHDERSRIIFLITDGAIHSTQIDELTARCRASDIRIFVVGVGFAGGDDVFAAFAKATGGAVELVHPNEDMANCVVRHFQRVRKSVGKITRIQWPSTPSWTHVPNQFYSGDTIRIFARFDQKVEGNVNVQWQSSKAGQVTLPIRRVRAGQPISTLARMAASQRFALSKSHAEQVSIALDYQLLTDQTSVILVAVRAEGDKAGDTPDVVRVPQMMAAGWAGMGAKDAVYSMDVFNIPDCFELIATEDLTRESPVVSKVPLPVNQVRDLEMRFVSKLSTTETTSSVDDLGAFLRWLAMELNAIANAGDNLYDALSAAIMCWNRTVGGHQSVLHEIAQYAKTPSEWLALVEALAAGRGLTWSGLIVVKRIVAIEPRLLATPEDLAAARINVATILSS